MYGLSLVFILRFISFHYTAIFLNAPQKERTIKVIYEAAGSLHAFM